MPEVVFIDQDGGEHPVEAEAGQPLMQAAVDNMVPGILAECGGCCSCATCHVHVDPAWQDRLGQPGDDERMMLEGEEDAAPNSRLPCQVIVQPDWGGLRVTVADNA